MLRFFSAVDLVPYFRGTFVVFPVKGFLQEVFQVLKRFLLKIFIFFGAFFFRFNLYTFFTLFFFLLLLTGGLFLHNNTGRIENEFVSINRASESYCKGNGIRSSGIYFHFIIVAGANK